MTILIVDDEPVNTLYLEQILQSHHYETCSVNNGQDALRILNEENAFEKVDLVLLDVDMPGISGLETCMRIREIPGMDELPVIMVSGRAEEKEIVEGLDAQASDYMTKPIRPFELLARIRAALRYKHLIDERKRYEARLQYDLDLAQKIQQSVLTDSIYNEDLALQALYFPSKKLAGDMYAWFQITPKQYGVIIFDVMGHGISSALITMGIRSILQELIQQVQDPVAVVTELNRQMTFLFSGEELASYFTAIYCLIDLEAGTIDYVNAGHPPLFVSQDGTLRRLTQTGVPVGMFEDATYASGRFEIDGPAVIHLFTDGLLECYSKDIDVALEAMQRDVEAHGVMYETFVRERFMTGKELSDDLCLVTIQLN